jgi:transcriptional regulator with XRE-family HTH domain
MHVASRPKKFGSWYAVGALVAHFRKKARLTQEQFAEVASLSVDTQGVVHVPRHIGGGEQEAMSILSYQSLVIPGLLQTRDYCRAVFDYRYPALRSETAEQWVNARMERQLIWQRERPPVGHFVLEESILRREVGGPEVMREPVSTAPWCCWRHLSTSDLSTLRCSAPAFSCLIQMRSATITFSMELRSQALSPDESVRLLNGLPGES